MHTLSESGRCVSAMYLMILGWKKKGGDNLRGSLDKVTNVEAFEGLLILDFFCNLSDEKLRKVWKKWVIIYEAA